MKKIVVILLVVLSSVSFGQDPCKNVYTESAWTARDKWQKADELIRNLNIKPGSKVADVGCHEGYITIKLSGTVGKTGKVFAVDVEQTKLNKLKAHWQSERSPM